MGVAMIYRARYTPSVREQRVCPSCGSGASLVVTTWRKRTGYNARYVIQGRVLKCPNGHRWTIR